jgi:hypothetical protein
VYPRTLDTFILLGGFVRPRPITLCVPPQSGEGVRESGWRRGRGEGLAEVVQSHLKSPCLMTSTGRNRAATATTAGRAVVLVAMEAATVLAIMMFIALVMLMSMPLLLPMSMPLPMLLLLFLMLLLLVVLSLLLPSASFRMPADQYKRNQTILTDHDRAKLRSGWMSPSSAALIASRYVVRASPSLTRLAEPHVNADRPSFIAIRSAIRRACLPLPFGNG